MQKYENELLSVNNHKKTSYWTDNLALCSGFRTLLEKNTMKTWTKMSKKTKILHKKKKKNLAIIFQESLSNPKSQELFQDLK